MAAKWKNEERLDGCVEKFARVFDVACCQVFSIAVLFLSGACVAWMKAEKQSASLQNVKIAYEMDAFECLSFLSLSSYIFS